MNDPSVRKQKSGDQLAVGDWLAPKQESEGACEVLFALAYPASADGSRDNVGKHVHLVVREQGGQAPWATTISGTSLYDLASEEDLAGLREAAERAARIAEMRALAAWLEANPWVPLPYTAHAYDHLTAPRDVPTEAAGLAKVRGLAERLGLKTDESLDDRTKVVVPFGEHTSYELVTWHKDGRPAEPAPSPLLPAPIATHYEAGGWKGEGPGTCGVECACGVTYDGFDSLAEAKQQLAWHIADPKGQDYGRADTAEADDPTPVSGGRVQPHTGELVGTTRDARLVDADAPEPEGRVIGRPPVDEAVFEGDSDPHVLCVDGAHDGQPCPRRAAVAEVRRRHAEAS